MSNVSLTRDTLIKALMETYVERESYFYKENSETGEYEFLEKTFIREALFSGESTLRLRDETDLFHRSRPWVLMFLALTVAYEKLYGKWEAEDES